ncbi:MAG: SMP-30/gluconolactonase/LRE family protein [Acidimicrobiales bacterium]
MSQLAVLVDGVDFGEGPRWHDGRLWYSDFYHQTVYAVTPDGEQEAIVRVEQQPSGLGWLPDGQLLIVSMKDRRLLRYDGTDLHLHADLSDVAAFWCNDMVVDERGNAYVGNFGFDLFTAGRDAATTATLALVRPDGTVEAAAPDLGFPNGSVITSDGRTLIVGESMASRFTAFDINDDATLTNRRVWAETPGCVPDGCTLDAEGGIWVADARGQRVVRYVEGGELTDEIATDQPAFACMLGGDDGTTLFILTAPSSSPELVAGQGKGAIVNATVAHPRAGRP